MPEASQKSPESSEAVEPEVVDTEVVAPDIEEEVNRAVTEPARVMRIGAMIRQLLEEVRQAPLDEASRDRLRGIYEISIEELGSALSEELREELQRLTSPFTSETPSESELRIAQAQLVGWLEGLFHGMQAALFAQQMAARDQLQEMRSELPPPAQKQQRPQGGVYL
ncbi:MAG: proteasome activator [Acidimicrobiales bacterium]